MSSDEEVIKVVRKKKDKKKTVVTEDADSDNEQLQVVKKSTRKDPNRDLDDDHAEAAVEAGSSAAMGSSGSCAVADKINSMNWDAMTEADLKQFMKDMPKRVIVRSLFVADEEEADAFGGIPPDWEAIQPGLQETTREYSYAEMLCRAMHFIQSNPLLEKKDSKIKLPMIKLGMEGSKKTVFSNFAHVCKVMQRTVQEVMDFLVKDLGISANLDINDSLIMKGRFKTPHIENLLIRYMTQYCQCNMCGGVNTVLTRDPSSRLQKLQCKNCGAERTVQTASAGYKAQTTKRKLMRK